MKKKISRCSRTCLWECMRVGAWASTQHNLALLPSRVIGDQHHTVRHLRATQTMENPVARKTTRRWRSRGRKVWIHPVTWGLRNIYQAHGRLVIVGNLSGDISCFWSWKRPDYPMMMSCAMFSKHDSDYLSEAWRQLSSTPCTATHTTPQSYCSMFSFDLM